MRPSRAVDAATGLIDALAARVVEYPRSLFDARSAIAAEQCDVIFYPEIGMDELTYYLAFARLAPVQCVSWGHPVTTGIPAIDYFISARDLEPGGADSHYSERLVRLASPPTCYSRPSRPSAALDRESFGVPSDATLYLCPQSLFKFHPDFDAALAAIVREDPRANRDARGQPPALDAAPQGPLRAQYPWRRGANNLHLTSQAIRVLPPAARG
jgi:protein O-GlcNAc transferase